MSYIYIVLFLITASEAFNPCDFEVATDYDISVPVCEGDDIYFSKGNSAHSCFPSCFPKIDDIDTYSCDDDNTSPIMRPCPLGYVCRSDKCEIDEKSCFKYYANYASNKWHGVMWKPKCTSDGKWTPVQCKGEAESKRCFCYSEYGERIFGQEFRKQENSTMNCGCSRKRLELKNKDSENEIETENIKSNFYTSLHCSANGNYEEVQCNAGSCWCVEPITGEIISTVVPESMIKYLECYAKTQQLIGENYMRQCESKEYAQKKILHELKVHGTTKVTFDHLLCDADGSYGAFQISNAMMSCRWRDNTKLKRGEGSATQYTELNCNCARDEKIFELAGGLYLGKLCTEVGSYRPVQQLNDGRYYCVDSDGYPISDYGVDEDYCKTITLLP